MPTATQTIRSPGTTSLPTARGTPAKAPGAIAKDEELPHEFKFVDEPSIFEGASVWFPNKSQWRFLKPLSPLKLQRVNVPCEARQVFGAVCVEDPSKNHSPGDAAVIKIKFQVSATEETIDDYQDNIDEVAKELAAEDPEDAEETQAYLTELKKGLRNCTRGTKRPNLHTINEVAVLYHLTERKCSSTPRLLNFEKDVLDAGAHRKAIEGGYIVFILMTKVPGRQLSSEYLRKLTSAERENVREDFSNALRDLLRCGIVPTDTGLRNLMWDKENRKCYIVDFEDTLETSPETLESMATAEYMKKEYKYWGLSEGYFEKSGIVRD